MNATTVETTSAGVENDCQVPLFRRPQLTDIREIPDVHRPLLGELVDANDEWDWNETHEQKSADDRRNKALDDVEDLGYDEDDVYDFLNDPICRFVNILREDDNGTR